MLFGIPIAIWFGFLTFTPLFIIVGLGIAMHHWSQDINGIQS